VKKVLGFISKWVPWTVSSPPDAEEGISTIGSEALENKIIKGRPELIGPRMFKNIQKGG